MESLWVLGLGLSSLMNNQEVLAYVTFLFNELLFFLYLWNIHTVFFWLDDDVRERRNIVYY